MWYFFAPGRYLHESSPANSWGEWETFIEVGDDQLASRQICRFRNGNILCYDSRHRRDDFGCLVGLKFSLKAKWQKFFPGAEEFTAAEFAELWQRSIASIDLKNYVVTNHEK